MKEKLSEHTFNLILEEKLHSVNLAISALHMGNCSRQHSIMPSERALIKTCGKIETLQYG